MITLYAIIKKGSPLIYDTRIKLHTKLGYNNSSVIIDWTVEVFLSLFGKMLSIVFQNDFGLTKLSWISFLQNQFFLAFLRNESRPFISFFVMSQMLTTDILIRCNTLWRIGACTRKDLYFSAKFHTSFAARGFGLRPKMCRPSANAENSRRTRENCPWYPGYTSCFKTILILVSSGF